MANDEYKRNRHSCYMLEYHLVVVTKYRHPVITEKLKDRLLELSKFVIEECWECSISTINTDKDHILFRLPYTTRRTYHSLAP